MVLCKTKLFFNQRMNSSVRMKLIIIVVLVNVIMCKGKGRESNNHKERKRTGPVEMSVDAMKLYHSMHGDTMGSTQAQCDDGVNGIEMDWDPWSDEEITCYKDDVINREDRSKNITDTTHEVAMRVCLNKPIHYSTDLPLSGSHRLLWPMFGEYKYLPPQRWILSLEHGGIALLYHPCMTHDPVLAALKSLVRDCLGKHVITPYRNIPDNMPFALLAFRHARLIGLIDPESEDDVNLVVEFITKYALTAPETHEQSDGQYWEGIIQSATRYSDLKETRESICAFL